MERVLERRGDRLTRDRGGRGLGVVAVEPYGLQGVRMVFNKPTEKGTVEEVVRTQDPSGEVRQSSPEVWLYDLSAAELQHMRTSAVDQAVEKIRNRIDAFGV